jgi:hypothetical protein
MGDDQFELTSRGSAREHNDYADVAIDYDRGGGSSSPEQAAAPPGWFQSLPVSYCFF